MRAVRLLDGPIISPDMCDRIGTNINGPSLVRVPDWVEAPLAKYYLYFAHHRGDHIRLAYADAVIGPWTVYSPGVLPLAASGFAHHLASPEVVIDDAAREIRMFFHGGDEIRRQYTRLAVSRDGLTFGGVSTNLMNPYARIFAYGGWCYALTMPGQLYRSRTGRDGFQLGPRLFTEHMRHSAVRVLGDTLQVIYSNRGDAPESLLMSEVDLRGDWMAWREGPP